MVEPQQRAWCFFRNVVHATYREIRHIGPLTDSDAKLHVSDRKYVSAAERCSKGREVLKRADLFQQTADARTVDEVLQCYYDATHLHLQDLITLFGRHGWSRSYGGQKWATIASNALELAAALRKDDLNLALPLCTRIKLLEHNSGPLVPSARDWRSNKYLQEKWPQPCE